MTTKVLIYKKIEDEPEYCPDRYELLQISRPCKNSHCFQKVAQLFMRDSNLEILCQIIFKLEIPKIRVGKKVLLKEEILPHY